MKFFRLRLKDKQCGGNGRLEQLEVMGMGCLERNHILFSLPVPPIPLISNFSSLSLPSLYLTYPDIWI
ncbi:unnamed protein product [Trifolium pratense]|uniref:Uncharacterized protein n=1 Tax=Trifolium pratense TaxID=57577 RepID=A0ACB0LKS7_TRIPR|nr:unnamed protein product [Trifolium pratense]